MHRNYIDSEQIIVQKGIAARATLSGFNQNYRPNKRSKKFIVTLKPVLKPGQDETSGACRCEKSVHENGRLRLKAEDALREKATILNAFRLLANSKFMTIDPNTGDLKNVNLVPPFSFTRLAGGSENAIKQKDSRHKQKDAKKLEPKQKEIKRQDGKQKEDRPKENISKEDKSKEEKPKENKSKVDKQIEAKPKDEIKDLKEEKQQKNIQTDKISAESAATSLSANKEKPPKDKTAKKEKSQKKGKPSNAMQDTTASQQEDTSSEATSKEKCLTEICKPRELKKHSEVIKNNGQNDLNVKSNHSQRECNRIILLEQQVQNMRKELSQIKREFIPQDEIVRYSALALRLQELNAMLTEMKQSCTASITTTPSIVTSPSNYNNEHVQKVQNYRSCHCKPECTNPNCSAKKTEIKACTAFTKATEPLVRIKQPEVEPQPEPKPPPKSYTNSGTQPETKPTTDSSIQVQRSPHAIQQDGHSQTSGSNLRPTERKGFSIYDYFPERAESMPLNRRPTVLENSQKPLENKLENTQNPSPTNLERRPTTNSQGHRVSKIQKLINEPNEMHGSSSALFDINEEKNSIKTVSPNNIPQMNSFCLYCEGVEVPIVDSNLQKEILNIIQNHSPSVVALTIVMQSDNLYHINIAVMKTGESLGCLFATEAAINRANQEHVFEEFLTFFVVDAKNTMEQKNRILGHTFEIIQN